MEINQRSMKACDSPIVPIRYQSFPRFTSSKTSLCSPARSSGLLLGFSQWELQPLSEMEVICSAFRPQFAFHKVP
ncbi:hypothetical protein NHX12_019181 [Muraenolepis orangiensis]|uniref:Uncharacterized protein n=1 Tax=Muraenolepis orangiensis TaxID=630683 RepID=A0A9Q0IVT9_9TELE|nr:hypothetical protein NHX12_019181 [Muraenolepis orangiensis]